MRRPEFSLSGLMLFVALCGLALAVPSAFDAAVDDPPRIVTIQASADGQVLAAELIDRTIKFFDGESGRLLGALGSGTGAQNGKLSPDGTLFAYSDRHGGGSAMMGGGTQQLVIHDLTDNRELSRTPIEFFAGTLEFMPNGSELLFSTGKPAEIVVWNIRGGVEDRRLVRRSAVVLDPVRLVVSPNGKTLAIINRTEGQFTRIELFDLDSWRPQAELNCGSNAKLEFSGDSRRLVLCHLATDSIAAAFDISVLDLADLSRKFHFRTEGGWSANVALSREGDKLAVAWQDLEFWDVRQGVKPQLVEGILPQDLAAAPAADAWFTAGQTDIIRWDATSLERVGTISSNRLPNRIVFLVALSVILLLVWGVYRTLQARIGRT